MRIITCFGRFGSLRRIDAAFLPNGAYLGILFLVHNKGHAKKRWEALCLQTRNQSWGGVHVKDEVKLLKVRKVCEFRDGAGQDGDVFATPIV